MKLSEIYAILDSVAPKSLSDEYCAKYGAYDNSGILVDTGDDITSIVFSLDFSYGVIERAIATGANLIVVHHPAIYGKIANVVASDVQPLGEKLIRCIKNGISVVAMHLNLDSAIGGIDESLCQGLCLATGSNVDGNVSLMHPLTLGGYGRAYNVKETPFVDFVDGIKKVFRSERVIAYGEHKKIRKVASFCGAGVDEASITFALNVGADVIVSSDWKHHLISFALERGLAVVVMTHYASEFYGFEKYYKKMSQMLTIPCVLHTDEELL